MCRGSCVLFFKQKTAYEMRISDWSSDVCSSDLRGDIAGPVGAASESSPLTVRGVRPVLQASVQAALPGRHFRGMIAPNNSFNPNPLRSTNNMANRACHVVGSTTQVGLTQALARKDSYDSIGKSKSDMGGIGVGRQESTVAYLHPSIGIDWRASRRSRPIA